MKSFSFLLLLWIPFLAKAQEPAHYCATPPEKSEWLEAYQKNPEAYHFMRSSNDTLYVALTVHNISADGITFFPDLSVMNALCKLNNDFKPLKVVFYLKRPIRKLANPTWFDHNFQQGFQMMAFNNFNDSANCYIVGGAAGACGYFSPGADGVALAISCLGANNSTWTHEMGHFFSLPHTFVGWEGTNYNAGEPTPIRIGNRNVELVDRSNCRNSADGFCDTEPDYLSNRWTCNSNGLSNAVLKDPNEETFRADGTLYMSYSNDACTNRFSEEQIDAMRANMLSQRINITSTQRPYTLPGSREINILTEQNSTFQVGIQEFVEWEPVEDADGYVVQISRFASFSAIEFFTTVSGPQFDMSLFRGPTERNFHLRIRPIVSQQFCTNFSERFTFQLIEPTTSLVSSNFENDILVFPNPIYRGNSLHLQKIEEPLQYKLLSTTGQIVKQGNLDRGNNTLWLDASLPSGMLLLHVFNAQKEAIYKIIVQ
jgi:hypothetical protein